MGVLWSVMTKLYFVSEIFSVELPWFVITTMQCVHSDSHSCVDSVSTFQSVYLLSVNLVSTFHIHYIISLTVAKIHRFIGSE